MTDWQFIRLEYRLARLWHGPFKALELALAANAKPLPF